MKKEKIKFDYDEWSGNLYITLDRFKHRTTGTIIELAEDINVMIDKKKGVVIGLLIMNYKYVSAEYLKGKDEHTSAIQFLSKMMNIAMVIEGYYENELSLWRFRLCFHYRISTSWSSALSFSLQSSIY